MIGISPCRLGSPTSMTRSSSPEVLLGKGFLKIFNKFTGARPYRSVISKTLQSNFIEITLRYGCSPVNLLYIFRAPFLRNTSGGLLLYDVIFICYEIQSNLKVK